MKILLFTDSLGAGGAQRQLVGLANLLKEKGWNVKVSTYHAIDFYKSFLDECSISNEIIPGASSSLNRIYAVYRYLQKESPDWVIAYQETPSLVACAAKMLGCKYRLIVSERNTTQKVSINEYVRFFLYRWADSIVPNSYSQEAWLSEHYPALTDKITTISNFVDLDKFHYVNHERQIVPTIVVAASLWESKNARGLVHACRYLKDRNIKFKILWYGINASITDYEKTTIEIAKSLEVNDVIEFLPKTKQIEEKYREADYFCLPSFYEGTPNVICEAISTGLPVMCSNVCDNPIYVQDGINGILFDPNSPVDIAQKIESLLSQPQSNYKTYRENSRKIAEAKLSKELFVERYLNIIKHGKSQCLF